MKLDPKVEEYRIKSGMFVSPDGCSCGMFLIPYQSYTLTAMAYDGEADGWEHVSVSLKNRCPNWEEMSFIKDLFWDAEETVIQFHVPKSQHRNLHPHCLHLWRNKNVVMALPDPLTVAPPQEITELVMKNFS